MTEFVQKKLVIITGMSGAGKTVAVQSFEDIGYYCIDNLPPILLPQFLEMIQDEKNNMVNIALVMDLRGREFFDSLFAALDEIQETENIQEHIIFLDSNDNTLVSRYKETRRSHPLAIGGLPLMGIQREREILGDLRGRAQRIINTSTFKPKELREYIAKHYAPNQTDVFSVHFVSFGFKYGILIDADLVFDVRFLPNPHYLPQLRPLTGLNTEVASYVLKWSETQKFKEKIIDLLDFVLPQYKKEGKSQLVVAIGCTGGQHRSVTLVEDFANAFSGKYSTYITHRDIDKRKE